MEKVAQLEGAPASQAGLGVPTHGLRALARDLTDAESDLVERLESRIRALHGDHDGEFARIRRMEARDPEAFLAGAVAGFALARGESSVCMAGDSPEAGIAQRPVESAQTGPGGLGSLEIPESSILASKAK